MTRKGSALVSDRRRDRRNVPEEALQRYLDATARRHDLAAIVLADGDGRSAGSSLAGHDLGRLAALGVACARGDVGAVEQLESLAGDDDVYAHGWTVDGTSFRLISIRGRVPRVREVAGAVQRIRGGMHA